MNKQHGRSRGARQQADEAQGSNILEGRKCRGAAAERQKVRVSGDQGLCQNHRWAPPYGDATLR
jgi:hypothetical protein